MNHTKLFTAKVKENSLKEPEKQDTFTNFKEAITSLTNLSTEKNKPKTMQYH